MASGTVKSGSDVGFVDKADGVRHPVDPQPVDGLFTLERIPHLCDLDLLFRGFSRDCSMAEHALLHGWHAGIVAFGHITMAEGAIDLQGACMGQVGVAYGLLRALAKLRSYHLSAGQGRKYYDQDRDAD